MNWFVSHAIVGVCGISIGFVIGALWCSFFRYPLACDTNEYDEHEKGGA